MVTTPQFTQEEACKILKTQFEQKNLGSRIYSAIEKGKYIKIDPALVQEAGIVNALCKTTKIDPLCHGIGIKRVMSEKEIVIGGKKYNQLKIDKSTINIIDSIASTLNLTEKKQWEWKSDWDWNKGETERSFIQYTNPANQKVYINHDIYSTQGSHIDIASDNLDQALKTMVQLTKVLRKNEFYFESVRDQCEEGNLIKPHVFTQLQYNPNKVQKLTIFDQPHVTNSDKKAVKIDW